MGLKKGANTKMKRWEQFNQICHTNDSAEKQVEDMIIAKKENGDYMPDEESLRRAMLDWMYEDVEMSSSTKEKENGGKEDAKLD